MNYSECSEILISDDFCDNPRQVRFQVQDTDVDLDLLSDVITIQQTFPIGTASISLGSITSGFWLYVKPVENNVGLSINGGSNLVLVRGKATKLWVNFTSLSLTITGVPTKVLIAFAGQ